MIEWLQESTKFGVLFMKHIMIKMIKGLLKLLNRTECPPPVEYSPTPPDQIFCYEVEIVDNGTVIGRIPIITLE